MPDFDHDQRALAEELRIDLTQLDAEPERDAEPAPEPEPRRRRSAPRRIIATSGRRLA